MSAAILLFAIAFAQEAPAPVATAPTDAIAIPAYRQANHVAVLTIRGPVDALTLRSLERRVKEAIENGAEAIVLDLDTPGGELKATLDICHLIKTDMPANTLAWVNPQAYSAGTIMALACREIVVAPGASFGDAAPIQAGPLGIQPMSTAERAKQESPILDEVVDSARRNHYDENLVQAFVSVGVELWLLENVHSGERVFVDRAEYRSIFGADPPDQMTPVAPPAGGRPVAPVRPWFNTVIPMDEEAGQLTAAERQELLEHRRSLAPARPPLTAADRGDLRLLTQVSSSDQLLTVKSAEARFYGLATATIAGDEDLRRHFGAQTIRRYDRSWSEAMVRGLTHPIAMGLLIVIFLVCLFVELATPGVGVFGATAAAALLLLVGAPYLAGMAQWWDILLIAAGILLVAVELFVLPGFTVTGVAGVVALLLGLVGTFIRGDLGSAQGQTELFTGLVTTLTALFAAGIAAWLIARQLHSWPLFNRLILRAAVSDRVGEEAGLLAAMGPDAAARAPGAGDIGVAATDLRPAGRGEFAGRLHDVKSVGQFVEKGRPIRVLSAGGFVVEVEEAD